VKPVTAANSQRFCLFTQLPAMFPQSTNTPVDFDLRGQPLLGYSLTK
jgi:hypothetical protein